MTGAFLIAWVVFPVLLLVISAGMGLGLRALTGGAIPGVLVLPAGLAAAVVLCTFVTNFRPTAVLAGPLAALLAAAGFMWTWRRGDLGRPAVDGWALVAAAVPFAVVAAPVVLSGAPTFTGYARILDIAYQFDLSSQFATGGRVLPKTPDSSYQVVIQKYLSNGYPGGGQATLGSLSALTPVDLAWLYQTYLAYVAAMMGLALYSLTGTVLQRRWLRALAALIAAQPNILIAYTLVGGIKELDTACFLILSAALFAAAPGRPWPGRTYLAFPLAVSAAFSSLQLTVAPWFGVLLATLFLSSLYRFRSRLRVLAGWLQMGALFAIVTGPSLAASLKLLPIVRGRGIVDLGNLAAPVPNWAAAGVWLSRDHRFPLSLSGYPTATYVLIGVTLALAAIGVFTAVRARAVTLLCLGVSGAVAIAYVSQRYGPWVQLKAQCVTAPIALLFAFVGAAGLAGGRAGRRPLPMSRPARSRRLRARVRLARMAVAVGAGLAVTGGVLFGNALAYHNVTLAPYARLHDLERIGERFHGQGPALYTDFEEYAEYFLRGMRATVLVNPPFFQLRPGVDPASEPGGKFVYDINEFAPSFLQKFRFIVRRRNPTDSRPPADYRLVLTSPYHEVWERDPRGPVVVAHFPLDRAQPRRRPAFCAYVASQVRRAGPTARIAFAPAATPSAIAPAAEAHSPSLRPLGGVFIGYGPGRAAGSLRIPRSTSYAIWQSGSFGRPVSFWLDGHRLGHIAYQESYPGQYVLLSTPRLGAGVHVLSLLRAGGSLHPGSGDGVDPPLGDGFTRTIGPTLLRPIDQPPDDLGHTSLSGFGALCRGGRPWDWIEVIRDSGLR